MKKPTGRRYTIYSLKGGQGKTSISINLALELDCCVITNDFYSPLEKVLPSTHVLKLQPDHALPTKEELENGDIIFDFGGYLDSRVIPALEMSSHVLIPVTEFDTLSGAGFVNTIEEVKSYNDNIVIILNRVNDETAAIVRKELKKEKYSYPVFEIKESKVMKKLFEKKKPVSEIVKEGGLSKYLYKPISDQFDKLIKYLNEK